MRNREDEIDDGMDLPGIRSRVAQLEQEIQSIELKLEWNHAVTSLLNHAGWQGLVARLQTIMAGDMRKLQRDRMDSYELGLRQGRLAVLAVVTQVEPLQRKALDDANRDLTLKRAALDEERALLR